jgi:polyphosphate kinase
MTDTVTEHAAATAPLPPDRFADRELSWLAFNERVLELAEDTELPLLERAKFLAIFASNLDEFFMVRVAGLKRRIDAGIAVRAASGLMPRDLLELILSRTRGLMDRHSACFNDSVLPALRSEGIQILRYHQASPDEQDALREMFAEKVFPVLTPLAVDPAHPFPYISGLSLNLAVVVRNPITGTELFARVKVAESLHRFVKVAEQRFVPLEEVIAANLGDLFPGMEILQKHSFRVTRNEDVEVEEDDAENLLKALERELMRRRFGPPVRLEVERSIDPYVLELLVRELGISMDEVFSLPGPLDLTGLWNIYAIDREDLKESRSCPRRRRSCPRWRAPRPRTCSRRCVTTTCCCTTRTTASPRASSASWSRPRPTRRCWRSSRPCTGPRATRPSSTRSSTRPRPASRCWPWSRSRPDSTSRPTSPGRASSRSRASTWSTAWSA